MVRDSADDEQHDGGQRLADGVADEDVRGRGTDEVERAYAELAARYHPELYRCEPRHVREAATGAFARIERARHLLVDEQMREVYATRVVCVADDTQVSLTGPACLAADLARGEHYIGAHRYDLAVEFLESVLARDPDHPRALMWLGWADFRSSGGAPSARAAECLRRSVELSPTDPQPAYYLGRLCKDAGWPDRARQFFRLAVHRDRAHEQAARELRLLELRGEIPKPPAD